MPPTEYTKEAFDKEVDALVTKMRAYEPKVDGKTIHAAFDYALKMHGAQARECAGVRAPGVGLGMTCGSAIGGAFAHAHPLCARDENFMVVCLRLKSRRCAHCSLASYPQARISCAEKPASHSNCLHIGWSAADFCNAPERRNLRERYAFPQVVAGGSAMRARGRHPNV